MDAIDEIKEKVSILDLCSQAGIEVGRNNFIHSIYREEKTPSLKIYPEQNSFNDFGSNQGGSVIDFYMGLYNCNKAKAINELKTLAGLDNPTNINTNKQRRPPLIKPRPAITKSVLKAMTDNEKSIYYQKLGDGLTEAAALVEAKKERLLSNTEVYEEFHYYCLTKFGFKNKTVRNYLFNERKLEPKQVEIFRIFYVDNYYQVSNHLKKEFPIEQLKNSGLFNNKGNLLFYKHRLIIPYTHKYNIVYLRGRYFDENGSTETDGNKYFGLINDPLNVCTPKRFYNSDLFIDLLEGERVYIVEGEFDAIALEGLGFNALAIPGAGNIPADKFFIKLLKQEVIICADNDNAGGMLLDGNYKDKEGKDRYKENNLLEIFRKLNKEVFIKKLPAKDVTDFVRELEEV